MHNDSFLYIKGIGGCTDACQITHTRVVLFYVDKQLEWYRIRHKLTRSEYIPVHVYNILLQSSVLLDS